MFVLSSEITIDKKRFSGVNEVKIKESVLEYANTCTIKLPTSSVLKTNGKRETQSVQTSTQFKVGEKVTVKLGYNGILQTEFVGFVKNIDVATPLTIECEGYSWQLRNKKNISNSWKETTLQQVLAFITKDTDIKLHPEIPNVPLTKVVIDNKSGTQALDELVKLLNGALTACFFDDVLYVGLTYQDVAKKTVKYKKGWNVISDSSLKVHKADDSDVDIVVTVNKPDGEEEKKNSGSDGKVIRKEKISAVTESEWLTKIAKAKLEQEKFDGYEGTIETFLEPYCRAGYRAEYTDTRYPEKNMVCFVTGVEVIFGINGARRNPEIGIKLSSLPQTA